ncbi:MAG: ribonuclease III [Deltaproteobacteria bacterium]|jgi:ribonuclease-3|nr:ribonuclease III [Deltaproteobacteria bacterium]
MQSFDVNQEPWTTLQTRLDYRFRRPDLLYEAVCHRSYVNEQPDAGVADNERLEFLGDAVLDLIVSQELFLSYPKSQEGELTRIRAEVVAEPSLAAMARSLDLGLCILLGRGERSSGGSDRSSLLANTLEALLGAVFLDGGLPAATKVIKPLIKPRIIHASKHAGHDFKSRLQEYLQAHQGGPPQYLLSGMEGPDHDRHYTVQVMIDGRVHGQGRSRTKKGAEQAAARVALKTLEVD